MKLNFHIFAVAALGKGLSGGDRIFIEFAKRLRVNHSVVIHVWKEGFEMCQRENLSQGVVFELINIDRWCKFGFTICYLARILKAVWFALFTKLDKREDIVFYSASEYWMDSLPGFVLKFRYPRSIWVVGSFQAAPNPFKGFTEGLRKNTYRFSAFVNWVIQLPIKPLIRKWADLVLVNNELERKHFEELDKQKKVLVILGAVNTEEINQFIKKTEQSSSPKKLPKVYDAVFQGRFHPQKGVEELIDIWKLVTKKMPSAKLAMIGDGPLMKKVQGKIKQLDLEKNIHLFGYIFDGPEKYKLFSQSRLVVHPAFFDSGGMASAEAMAFGLPCVGFNLESYRSYYPKGMVKVEAGNLEKFADKIMELLEDKNERDRIGKEAYDMINASWSWDQRVGQLLAVLGKTN